MAKDEFQGDFEEHVAGEAALSDDAFLGGRLQILQPEKGYRAGIDAVLLAASIPASEGEAVFEAGIGTGVVALCLAARVPGVLVTGIEIASRYAMIARKNASRNEMADRINILTGDITDTMRRDQADWPAPGSFAHACANPPFLRENEVQPPGEILRAQSHVMKAEALPAWIKVLASMVRPLGTVSVIHPASSLAELLAAMQPRLGGLTVMPLRARRNDAASRVIVRGTKGSKAPLRLLPGLALHLDEGNGFAPPVEAMLREAAPLEFL